MQRFKTFLSTLNESSNVRRIHEAEQLTLFKDLPDTPIKPRREPVVEHGFDTTTFNHDDETDGSRGAKRWMKILKALKLPAKARLQTDPYKAWVWENDELEIMTGNNPLTGKYAFGGRKDEKGFASAIGITGPKSVVKKAVNMIRREAGFVKDESRGERDFI